jgi:hypothetical protein
LKKNWKVRGRVTVKKFNGHETEYDDLAKAVLTLNKLEIDNLKYGHLGYELKIGDDWRSQNCWGGDSHVFRDCNGLIIPPWKVQETYRNLPNVTLYYGKWSYRWRRSFCSYVHDRDYRLAPVPYTRKRRGGTGNWYRYPKTIAQFRDLAALEVDEEVVEYGFKVRPRKRFIAAAWDDKIRSDVRNNSWKTFRRTQYKTK